jgi:cyclohexa-1,5-dienecarbonyl-CoA hydratase
VDVYAMPHVRTQSCVEVGIDAGVARLTLNRPPYNVLSVEVMDELNEQLDLLEYRTDLKLVVIAARGKYFCGGSELREHIGDRSILLLEGFHRILENMSKLDKPTLAVVGGPALGAGTVLAAACDLVIAAASAKFGQPEVKAGVFNTAAAALLPRLVGRKRALDIILGGAPLSAAEAVACGLITRAVPDDRLDAEAAALVQRFQESSAPVMQMARRAVVGGLDLPLADALRYAEDVYLNQLMGTEDADEGLRAIMGKRKPVWKDR